jgi:phosphomannomutase
MSDIKFGTDGWRAIIADDYTVKNVIRVARGNGLLYGIKGDAKSRDRL